MCSDKYHPQNESNQSKYKMKNIIKFLILISLMIGCKKVTGIGGVFFRSTNPQKAKEWYAKNLGLVLDGNGAPFEFKNANNQEEKNYLRLNYRI